MRGDDGADAFVRAGGWAMNNMEAVAYLSAERPLHLARDRDVQIALDLAATRFTRAAEAPASMLVQAVRAALFSAGAKPATDRGVFEEARAAFYEASEDVFHALLDSLLETTEGGGEMQARRWLRVLVRASSTAFNAAAPIPIDDPERAGAIAKAFRSLRAGLSGYGKQGQALFETLELPRPEAGVGKKGKRNGI